MELSICREEVLRYLGYSGQTLSEDILSELDACEQQVLDFARPVYVYRVFDCEQAEDGVHLLRSKTVLFGADIKRHLAGCTKVVLLAATLSADMDRLLAKTQITAMSRALMLDAAADVLIESVCDRAEREIHAQSRGMFATWRFSPGYGDFPVAQQNEILTLLDAQRRIGLCATDTSLLTPRKSVTAVIGLSEQELEKSQRGCKNCTMFDHCAYRKRGESCDGK